MTGRGETQTFVTTLSFNLRTCETEEKPARIVKMHTTFSLLFLTVDTFARRQCKDIALNFILWYRRLQGDVEMLQGVFLDPIRFMAENWGGPHSALSKTVLHTCIPRTRRDILGYLYEYFD
jgi:hypothetical protein